MIIDHFDEMIADLEIELEELRVEAAPLTLAAALARKIDELKGLRTARRGRASAACAAAA